MAATRTETEIASQPECWRQAVETGGGPDAAAALPRKGERVAVAGCGTSWFVAQSYAALREAAGHGETDAFAASEFPRGRASGYDRIIALSRSGTTSEVLALLSELRELPAGTVELSAITADPRTPVMELADHGGRVLVLDFADEESVVQTRFATSALALLRASVEGAEPVLAAAAQAERAIAEELPAGTVDAEQWTFLGAGWSCGLAQEAALKMREASGAWTEAYPAMEYRHGPISVTAPGRVAWMLGSLPAGLSEQIAATGGLAVDDALDPMADLVRVQRLAVAVAERRGLDPDHPRALTRSVILP
ncbi:SIS domain-containing protein [Phaeacidiphilus oryzae]|uniref:SIS domain-containing protein n=1 Tax=Phaeacidiphilus oryzae TaxID=348818 RepID=UPI0005623057|nr:SIS domain-containing protein [Phaeacidiphilus oryzae]